MQNVGKTEAIFPSAIIAGMIEYVQSKGAKNRIVRTNGITPLVERSRSGRGAHVWIFFKKPVSASLARNFGFLLLDKGSVSINLKSFQYYDRMYPSQDTAEHLGNLIALPLQGRALKNGNSAFVDHNWNAYPDQWDILFNHMEKLSADDIEKYMEKWQTELSEERGMAVPAALQSRLKPWNTQRSYRIRKTVVCSYLIAERRVNTLILLQSKDLLEQWVDELNRFLTIDETPPIYKTKTGREKRRDSVIGILHGSKNTLTGIVDVAMVGSMYSRGKFNEWINSYGMVIMDECHHCGSATSVEVMQKINARYVYGVTATPKRGDNLEQIIYMLLDQSDTVTLQKSVLQSRGLVIMCIRGIHGLLIPVKDHVFILYGDNSDKENSEVRKRLKEVPNEKSLILVATGQKIGEGFDYPRLDTLMLAAPVSFAGRLEQYIGRLNRDYEGKTEVIVYDYIDSHIHFFDRMCAKRLRTYKRTGFELITEGILSKQTVNAIYDSGNYSDVFEQDVVEAERKIIVSSPELTQDKVERFITLVKARQEAGADVTVITMDPENISFGSPEFRRSLVDEMRRSGINVIVKEEIAEHFAVIDDELVWHGGMNLLGSEDAWDNLIRIKSVQAAAELLEIALVPDSIK